MAYAVIAAVAVSLGTLFQLFQRHIAGEPLIPAELRRIVPWNAVAPLVLLAPLLIAIATSALSGGGESLPGEPETTLTAGATAAALTGAGLPAGGQSIAAAVAASATSEAFYGVDSSVMIAAMWGQAAMTLTLAAACIALLVLAFRANRTDLGLPADATQFFADLRLGARMWAASLVPIYAIMLALNFALEPTDQHPIIERLMKDHSIGVMLAAAFTAVVAAPLYEELAFRLVLQGWLERADMLLGSPEAVEPPAAIALADGVTVPADAAVATPPLALTLSDRVLPYIPLPTQWVPIAVSATLFGLAHWGHGVSPVPLILLGAILGYGYQRTHRIVPCITCHVLFNGFTFVLLALEFAARN